MGATTPEKRPKAEVVAHLMTPGLPNMTEGSSSSEQELRLVPQPSLPVPWVHLAPSPDHSAIVNFGNRNRCSRFCSGVTARSPGPRARPGVAVLGGPSNSSLRSREAAGCPLFGRHVPRPSSSQLSGRDRAGPLLAARPTAYDRSDSGRQCLNNQTWCAPWVRG